MSAWFAVIPRPGHTGESDVRTSTSRTPLDAVSTATLVPFVTRSFARPTCSDRFQSAANPASGCVGKRKAANRCLSSATNSTSGSCQPPQRHCTHSGGKDQPRLPAGDVEDVHRCAVLEGHVSGLAAHGDAEVHSTSGALTPSRRGWAGSAMSQTISRGPAPTYSREPAIASADTGPPACATSGRMESLTPGVPSGACYRHSTASQAFTVRSARPR